MQELLKVTGEERERLLSISYSLTRKADSFYSIGNETIAEYLDDVAAVLKKSSERVHKVVSQTIHEEFSKSMEMSNTIFKSTLVGAAMAVKDMPTKKALVKLHAAVDKKPRKRK